jgi:hypothetical protein
MNNVLNKLIEQELNKMSSSLTTELQKQQAKETLANVWRIMVSENLNQEAEQLKQKVESV